MQWIALLKLIPSLLPVIVEAVKAVEAVIVDPGLGANKKDLVLAAVDTSIQISGSSEDRSKVLVMVGTLIDKVVAIFNAIGQFKKTA